MTVPDYTTNWRRYWETVADGSARGQIAAAATDPVGGWVTADAGILVNDDVDIDPEQLRNHPDAVLRDAREGFEAFVDAREFASETADDYELLAIHVTGLGRVPGVDFSFDDPVDVANTLTQLSNVRLREEPGRDVKVVSRTYRCPAGHETTLHQSLHRDWTIETCGETGCSNEVTLLDSRTRLRRVVEFTVERGDSGLPCVATGRYADPAATDRLADATRLLLTGIPRFVTRSDGTVELIYEVLHAEPM